MTQRPDVIIVGSGLLGIAAARRLAEANLRVTVVEAGPAITDPAGSHFRNQERFRRDPDSFFGAIGRYLTPVSGDLPGAAWSSLAGGQGVLWTNNCPRAPSFQLWDALSAEAWSHAYRGAEALLDVAPDPAAASRTGAAISERLRDALAAEGRAIAGLPFSGRVSTEGDILFNGPWEIREAARPDVKERIDLRYGTTAMRLRHRAGRIIGVDLSGEAGSVSLEASIVLLAAGAVGAPLLLHRSWIRPEALGRGVSFHALLFGQVVLSEDLCPGAGDDDVRPRLWIPPTESAPWHIQVLRDTCPLQALENVNNPHRLLEFQAFLPMEFRDENALVIDDDGCATFRFAFSERDREGMRAMEADVRRLAERLGPWRRGCEPTWMPDGNGHLVGTCRMDRQGWNGVADRVGRVHGFDNLYLATVGMFHSSVSVNPTLTALALTLSTCDAITGSA